MDKKYFVSVTDSKGRKAGTRSSGFIGLFMIPELLVVLMLAATVMGCMSYMMRAVTFRNRLMQAGRLLEEDFMPWWQDADSGMQYPNAGGNFEKTETARTIGPYILLVKELRDKDTGKVVLNRFEFIPEGETDRHDFRDNFRKK